MNKNVGSAAGAVPSWCALNEMFPYMVMPIIRRRPGAHAHRAKVPALDSVFFVGGIVMLLTAIAGMAVHQSAILDTVYMDLSMTLPMF